MVTIRSDLVANMARRQRRTSSALFDTDSERGPNLADQKRLLALRCAEEIGITISRKARARTQSDLTWAVVVHHQRYISRCEAAYASSSVSAMK
jgi:hypothetical protein